MLIAFRPEACKMIKTLAANVKTLQLNYYLHHSTGFKEPKLSMQEDILSCSSGRAVN